MENGTDDDLRPLIRICSAPVQGQRGQLCLAVEPAGTHLGLRVMRRRKDSWHSRAGAVMPDSPTHQAGQEPRLHYCETGTVFLDLRNVGEDSLK